jgi:hypothetical protein
MEALLVILNHSITKSEFCHVAKVKQLAICTIGEADKAEAVGAKGN